MKKVLGFVALLLILVVAVVLTAKPQFQYADAEFPPPYNLIFGQGDSKSVFFSQYANNKFQIKNGSLGYYNGIVTAGQGLGVEVYNTSSGAQTNTVGATTMYTPTVAGTYRFTYYITESVVGASCATASTYQVAIKFQDQNAASAQTQNLGLYTTGSSNGTIGYIPWTSGPTDYVVNSGATPIQYLVTVGSVGSCSPNPTFVFYPVLEDL